MSICFSVFDNILTSHMFYTLEILILYISAEQIFRNAPPVLLSWKAVLDIYHLFYRCMPLHTTSQLCDYGDMFFRFYFLQILRILFSSKRKKMDITETFIICKYTIFLDSLGIILQCKKTFQEPLVAEQV